VPHTIVIGAGLAGLAAAVRLIDAGHRVTLIEATKAGGGRARSFVDPASGRELDNGQHLVMGCYRETLAFLRQIGVHDGIYFQRDLAIDMVKPGGKRAKLLCPPLPAPLHLAAGLLTMRGVGVLHKAAALRAGLLLSGEVRRPDDNETCDAWLRRLGQTAGIRAIFWEPLIWATLNDDPLVASAAMLMAVLERAFMSTRDASRLGVPRVPPQPPLRRPGPRLPARARRRHPPRPARTRPPRRRSGDRRRRPQVWRAARRGSGHQRRPAACPLGHAPWDMAESPDLPGRRPPRRLADHQPLAGRRSRPLRRSLPRPRQQRAPLALQPLADRGSQRRRGAPRRHHLRRPRPPWRTAKRPSSASSTPRCAATSPAARTRSATSR
jgi:hypothetical protein